jgi:5-formyltetrahydrofolate cyclo-ligase
VNDLKEEKKKLRELVKGKFEALTKCERERMSQLICSRAFELLKSIGAKTVMLYAPMDDEVDVEPLIEELLRSGVKVCLPKVDRANRKLIPRLIGSLCDRHITVGAYGIREPTDDCPQVDLSEIGAVIVPGRAFDRACRRVGRGGGYYDRFLKSLPQDALKVGVAFEFQIFDEVPTTEEDVAVDCVITETRIILSQKAKEALKLHSGSNFSNAS